MEPDINNLMQQINQLPQADKSKLLTFLLYQSSAIPQKDKEIIEFMTASSERLKKWSEETDEVIKETEDFIDELKRSNKK